MKYSLKISAIVDENVNLNVVCLIEPCHHGVESVSYMNKNRGRVIRNYK